MSHLTTARLVLREFTEGDVENVYRLNSDPDVMHHINGGALTSREHIADVVLPKLMARDSRCPELGYWAANEKSTGAFVGWTGLSPHPTLDPPRITVLGYRFVKSAWGRGYATESSRALLSKGFNELGVELVTADTLAINTGSRRVMEKLGMTLQRTFHTLWEGPAKQIEGFERGEVEYEISKSQFMDAVLGS